MARAPARTGSVARRTASDRGDGPPPFAAAGEGGVVLEERPVALRELSLEDDEIVLAMWSPSRWFVLLSCLGTLLGIACAVLGMAWAVRIPAVPWTEGQAFGLGAALAAACMAWQLLEWGQRLYVLTDRRVLRRSGVVRTRIAQERLGAVRHMVVMAAPRERWLRVGTVAFVTSAASGALDWNLAWECVRRPEAVQQAIREAIERYG